MAPGAGEEPDLPPLRGQDTLTRFRRRLRATMLSWAPLAAWKALLGLLLIIAAAVLRKYGILKDQGFTIMVAIGFGMWGYDMTLRQVNGVKAKREAREAREVNGSEVEVKAKPREK